MISICSLEISGYRGFATRQKAHFAVPTGNPGSGLTILVGPNGGGKSTILELLHGLSEGRQRPPEVLEGRRNKRAGDRVDLSLTWTDGHVSALATGPRGGSLTVWHSEESGRSGDRFLFLPSRRSFQTYFGAERNDRAGYMHVLEFKSIRTPRLNLYQRLVDVDRNESKRAAFDLLLSRIVDPPPKWVIESSDRGDSYVKCRSGDIAHSSEGLGDGILNLLFMVDALYDSLPGSVICIDEPELSLHPHFQRRLSRIFADYAKDRQIIIATHSAHLIDWESIVNGAMIQRAAPSGDECRVYPVSQDTRARLTAFLTDRNNPHVLGLDASGVFFLDDRIIVVEGQEDVEGYRRIATQLGIALKGEFFGWGTGGAEKMAIIVALLKDLGFCRVAGVLDQDKVTVCDELRSGFPTYCFEVSPAEDIRTRPVRGQQNMIKKGLLDEVGHLRSEFDADIRRMFERINNYFAPADRLEP